jgi:hypothetical protein
MQSGLVELLTQQSGTLTSEKYGFELTQSV